MAVFKEPAYRAAVCLIPGLSPFYFSHFSSLIKFHVAAVTQCCNAVIMGFHPPAFAIPQLVGVSGYYRPVLIPTGLAWRLANQLQQILISIYQSYVPYLPVGCFFLINVKFSAG